VKVFLLLKKNVAMNCPSIAALLVSRNIAVVLIYFHRLRLAMMACNSSIGLGNIILSLS
jgi:hypothetical protein